MTNNDHKEILISKTNELLDTIDKLPLHPKNKIMLYQRYVLSKISWHLTIADLPITWVKQNLDNIASKFICTWLEIPVAGTLNIIRQSKNKFDLGIILIPDRFIQCEVTMKNKLKNSKNRDICEIYDITKRKNITHNQYKTTREAVDDIRKGIASDTTKLTDQGLVIASIADYVDKKFNNMA